MRFLIFNLALFAFAILGSTAQAQNYCANTLIKKLNPREINSIVDLLNWQGEKFPKDLDVQLAQ